MKTKKVLVELTKDEFKEIMLHGLPKLIEDGFHDGNTTVKMYLQPDEVTFLEGLRKSGPIVDIRQGWRFAQ